MIVTEHQASKAGVAVAKLRSHSDGSIVALSKEIVKSWKDTVDIAKKAKKAKEGSSAPAGEVKKEGDNKRKREEESGAGGSGSGSGEVKNEVKKVKGEGACLFKARNSSLRLLLKAKL